MPDSPASFVKLRLQAICRRLGTAQKQARPLWLKGPVRNLEGDAPRGLNLRPLLESCAEDLPCLRDCVLRSASNDTGFRASELVGVAVEHIIEAIDSDARLLTIPRSKGDLELEGTLHSASVGPIYRAMIQRAFDGGRLADLTTDDLARLLNGINANGPGSGSTKICSRAARIWPRYWTRSVGNHRECRSLTIWD